LSTLSAVDSYARTRGQPVLSHRSPTAPRCACVVSGAVPPCAAHEHAAARRRLRLNGGSQARPDSGAPGAPALLPSRAGDGAAGVESGGSSSLDHTGDQSSLPRSAAAASPSAAGEPPVSASTTGAPYAGGGGGGSGARGLRQGRAAMERVPSEGTLGRGAGAARSASNSRAASPAPRMGVRRASSSALASAAGAEPAPPHVSRWLAGEP